MIAISLLDTDILRLAEKADEALTAGVDFIHLDFGGISTLPERMVPSLCSSLRSHGVSCPIEVRLPRCLSLTTIEPIIQSGADWISIDPEIKDLYETLQLIGEKCKKGFVVKSEMEIDHYVGFMHKIDFLAFEFESNSSGITDESERFIEKVWKIRNLIEQYNSDIQFSISGYVSQDVVKPLFDAGINRFIVGRKMLQSEDYYSLIAGIRKQTQNC